MDYLLHIHAPYFHVPIAYICTALLPFVNVLPKDVNFLFFFFRRGGGTIRAIMHQ